jgi:hypothetical protein
VSARFPDKKLKTSKINPKVNEVNDTDDDKHMDT